MIDLAEKIMGAESSYVMMSYVTLFLGVVIIVIGVFTVRILYNIHSVDRKSLQMLTAKSIEHDKEHIVINKRIEDMLQEMKNNRQADRVQADITRKLLIFVAKEGGIDIPDLK